MFAPSPQVLMTFKVVSYKRYRDATKINSDVDSVVGSVIPIFVTHLTHFYARRDAAVYLKVEPLQVELAPHTGALPEVCVHLERYLDDYQPRRESKSNGVVDTSCSSVLQNESSGGSAGDRSSSNGSNGVVRSHQKTRGKAAKDDVRGHRQKNRRA